MHVSNKTTGNLSQHLDNVNELIAAGSNKLNSLMKTMAEKAGFSVQNLANHIAPEVNEPEDA